MRCGNWERWGRLGDMGEGCGRCRHVGDMGERWGHGGEMGTWLRDEERRRHRGDGRVRVGVTMTL